MNREEKNSRIRQTLIDTRERHANMRCRTFEVKAVFRKLNRLQKEQINGIFREAKWLRNAYIGDSSYDGSDKSTVPVKVKDIFEIRELNYIGSQIKQSVISSVRSEIKGLHTKKEKSEKVGALKFKSYCNSVTLKQYGTTYSIDFANNRVKVQNVRKPIYVRGLKQIPEDAEIASAKMVRKADGIYFYITCYTHAETHESAGHIEGIDFGIQHNLTLTDGSTVDIMVPESKGVKLASKRLNRALCHNGEKKSKNHKKRKGKLRAAYKKTTDRKKALANQAVHDILSANDFVAIQDEMIKNWQSGLFGRQVQHSAMGTIKARLLESPKVHVVDRSYPSTQICPVCGQLTKHPLSKRDYDCSYCGYHHDSRDQKSALSILSKALKDAGIETS